eukprot:scaffold1704_cov67-Phaeocystis_antarctica.AAC.1
MSSLDGRLHVQRLCGVRRARQAVRQARGCGRKQDAAAYCVKAASARHPCELHGREMVRRGDGP